MPPKAAAAPVAAAVPIDGGKIAYFKVKIGDTEMTLPINLLCRLDILCDSVRKSVIKAISDALASGNIVGDEEAQAKKKLLQDTQQQLLGITVSALEVQDALTQTPIGLERNLTGMAVDVLRPTQTYLLGIVQPDGKFFYLV